MIKSYKSFTLHLRPRKSGRPVYYVQFRDDKGNRLNAKSSGQTSTGAAIRWAEAHMQHITASTKSIKFQDFANGFFDWDSDYAVNRRSTNKRFSERQSMELNALLVNRIIPKIGDLPLDEVSKDIIVRLRNDFYRDGLSPSTINRILSIINRILNSAAEENLIRAIPRIEKVAEISKRKGILSLKEIRKLFNSPWDDYRAFVANLLAFTTGLRQGEIMALQYKDFLYPEFPGEHDLLAQVNWECPDYKPGLQIVVSKTWNQKQQKINNRTKTGKDRIVYPPEITWNHIYNLVQTAKELGLHGEDCFIFYTFTTTPAGPVVNGYSLTRPCDSKVFLYGLYSALESIGISDSDRKKRNITFHSHRVMFNSILLNANIPIAKIQSLTGHSSLKMTNDTYYRPDAMIDVHKAIIKGMGNSAGIYT
jgi:integrase